MKINVITRCTRLQNLLTIKPTVFNVPKGIKVEWFILFDTGVLKDIDAKLLEDLSDPNITLAFGENDGWGLKVINPLIQDLEGWVCIMDDDNIIHPDFYTTILKNKNNNKSFIYSQFIGGKDFTGLDVREARPENVRVQKIDSAQYLIHTDLHKKYKYGTGYTADGEFIEKLYQEHPDEFIFIDKILCYYNYLEKKSKAKLPKILYIGEGQPELETTISYDYEARDLEVLYRQDDSTVNEDIVNFDPDCIISVGESYKQYPNLGLLPLNIRQKWIHETSEENLGNKAYFCAMNNILNNDNSRLISFFTPVYNTGTKLYDTYKSIQNQTHINWEWVIVNDSTDGGKTLKIAEDIASKDPRVKLYDFRQKSGGIIGDVKYKAACLTNGEFLAELDHDDLLAPECAEYIIKASEKYPQAGFFYTDNIEVDTNWTSLKYPDGFCFGYGSYRSEMYQGLEVETNQAVNINPKTIRHIVGVPNHIRVWKRDVYFRIGGHNRRLSIADDYELLIRTFLDTVMVKIPKIGYVQFIYNENGKANSHELARADIQRRVRTISNHYNEEINKRFKKLGLIDWAYQENPQYPLYVESKFGVDENYANLIYND